MVPERGLEAGMPWAWVVRIWTGIGFNSFGGPAGQIAVMHRELVDRRAWLSERRFLHGLNYCMVLPGPEAQQLATYVGLLMHGVRGAAVAGTLFVLPGALIMLALSIAYVELGHLPWLAGVLFGLQAAVLALVFDAVRQIGSRMLRSTFLMGLAIAAFAALTLGMGFPVVLLAAASAGLAAGRWRPAWLGGGDRPPPDPDATPSLLGEDETMTPEGVRRAVRAGLTCSVLWLAPVAGLRLVLGSDHVLSQIATLFARTALVTFGGAYAVLGYVADQATNVYGWVSPEEMATALGLAESTPGPLILVLQFVGFLAAYGDPGQLPALLAGTLGALVALWVTFVPCFMFIYLGAPFIERLRESRTIAQALTAVGAAVVGVIASLGAWLGLHTLFEQVSTLSVGPTALPVPVLSSLEWSAVLVVGLAALLLRRRVPTLPLLGTCAVAGMMLGLSGNL